MQYAQRVVLDEDCTTKPAQLHSILQQAKIFRPISASHIEYRGNKIRCPDLCSLQSAHYRKLDVGNGRGSRIRPVSSRSSVVDITTPTSPRAQDRPIKSSYKRDSFRIPSINAQYALRWRCFSMIIHRPVLVPFLSSAFAFDLFGFGVYTFPQGVAGAMSFHDPLEGTETTGVSAQVNTACVQQPSRRKSPALYAARRLTGDLPAREWHPCGCHSRLPLPSMPGTHRASAPGRAH